MIHNPKFIQQILFCNVLRYFFYRNDKILQLSKRLWIYDRIKFKRKTFFHISGLLDEIREGDFEVAFERNQLT